MNDTACWIEYTSRVHNACTCPWVFGLSSHASAMASSTAEGAMAKQQQPSALDCIEINDGEVRGSCL